MSLAIVGAGLFGVFVGRMWRGIESKFPPCTLDILTGLLGGVALGVGLGMIGV